MADALHLGEFQAYLLGEDRSPVHIAGYVGDVRLFAEWFKRQSKEPLVPGALTNEAVRGYKQYLLEQANKLKTINRRQAALAVYAHWLGQAGYVRNARNPVVKEVALAPKWLDLRLIYLRDAAIIKLKMSDVLLDERKGSVIIREGKGTKRRKVPLNAKARKAILDYLRMRPDVNEDSLFLGQRNEGVQSKTIQRVVDRFAKVEGLLNVTLHTFAKSLIDNGVSLEKVATLLCHNNQKHNSHLHSAGISGSARGYRKIT